MMKLVTVPLQLLFWQEPSMSKDSKRSKLAWIPLISKEESIWQLNKFQANSMTAPLRSEEVQLFPMSQLFQQTETERSVICLLIFTKRLVFMELSLSKREKHFITRLNLLMVWNSTEDTFLLTSLLMKKNKKLNFRIVTYS